MILTEKAGPATAYGSGLFAGVTSTTSMAKRSTELAGILPVALYP